MSLIDKLDEIANNKPGWQWGQIRKVTVRCTICDGRGWQYRTAMENCQSCGGDGYIILHGEKNHENEQQQ